MIMCTHYNFVSDDFIIVTDIFKKNHFLGCSRAQLDVGLGCVFVM